MNAKELRIGNWVLKYEYISGEYQKGIVTGDFIKWVADNHAKCEPIPLTPEILEQCGFVKMEVIRTAYKMFHIETVTEVYELGDLIDRGYFEVNVTTNPDDKSVSIVANGKPVKYLHQLQNLYFALKDEELQINL